MISNTLQRILELDPNNLTTYYWIAVSYEKVNMHDKAALYYSEALKVDPGFSAARDNLKNLRENGELSQ